MTISTAVRRAGTGRAPLWRSSRLLRTAGRAAAGLAIFALLVGGISVWVDGQERHATNMSARMIGTEDRIAAVESVLQQAQLGQRGYLLTGEAFYLGPYDRAPASIDAHLAALDSMLEDPREIGSLAVLRSLSVQVLASLRQSIERRRAGDEAGALAALRGGLTATLMDGVRDTVDQMRRHETETMTARAVATRSAVHRMEAAILALSLLCAALAVVALRATLRRARVAEASRDEILSRFDRRLMAVLAADIVGYSAAMERDEAGTLERLRGLRGRVDAVIARHGGEITGTAGDSVLAVFASALAAVDCAVEMQAAPGGEDALRFRVGVNVGDVIRQDGDVFGDTVNVAARLEALAEPGGICVSRAVRDHVGKQRRYAFEDLGLKAVKNIAEPVSAHRIDIVEALATG